MSRSSKPWRVVILGAALLGAVALGLFLHASRVPQAYQPPHLSVAERQEAVKDFTRQSQAFYNGAQDHRPFTWTLTQERLNAYLASADEIASSPAGWARPGDVDQMLETAGLARPMVDLHPGGLTFMVLSRRHGKVLSIELALEMIEPGRLKVGLAGTKLGRLPMPARASRELLEAMQAKLPSTSATDGFGANSGEGQFEAALWSVFAAVDREPIVTDCLIDGKEIRITEIEIGEDLATFHIQPLRVAVMRSGPAIHPGNDWPTEFIDPPGG